MKATVLLLLSPLVALGALPIDPYNRGLAFQGDGSLPVGVICMWSGNVTTNFDATGVGTNGSLVGWQLCNGSNGAPDLRAIFIKGWDDGVNPLGTGGGAYTPQGTVAAPTITGSTATEASHTHSVTAAGTVTITNTTETGTISWPAGVPTFTGTVPNKTNVMTVATGPAAIRQVATNGAATPAGTIAWPVGVPTLVSDPHSHTNAFTGSAVTSGAGSSHSHGVGTLAASAPAFTGTQATVEPLYVKMAFIIKLSWNK